MPQKRTPAAGATRFAHVRVSTDVHKQLKRVAVELEVRISDLIEDMVRKHLSNFVETRLPPPREPGDSG